MVSYIIGFGGGFIFGVIAQYFWGGDPDPFEIRCLEMALTKALNKIDSLEAAKEREK